MGIGKKITIGILSTLFIIFFSLFTTFAIFSDVLSENFLSSMFSEYAEDSLSQITAACSSPPYSQIYSLDQCEKEMLKASCDQLQVDKAVCIASASDGKTVFANSIMVPLIVSKARSTAVPFFNMTVAELEAAMKSWILYSLILSAVFAFAVILVSERPVGTLKILGADLMWVGAALATIKLSIPLLLSIKGDVAASAIQAITKLLEPKVDTAFVIGVTLLALGLMLFIAGFVIARKKKSFKKE